MSNKPMRDPYAEYYGSVEAIRLITDNISMLQEHGDGSETVQDKISKLSIALVKCSDTQMEAKKQYNARCSRIANALYEAESPNHTTNETLYYIVQIMKEVLQFEPIGDDDEEIQAEEN